MYITCRIYFPMYVYFIPDCAGTIMNRTVAVIDSQDWRKLSIHALKILLLYLSCCRPLSRKNGIAHRFVHNSASHGLTEWTKHGASHLTGGIQLRLCSHHGWVPFRASIVGILRKYPDRYRGRSKGNNWANLVSYALCFTIVYVLRTGHKSVVKPAFVFGT